MNHSLLDPRNDLVFKLLFTHSLPLLTDLINAVRSSEPPVSVVSILDPLLAPEDVHRKFIILDILATDADGHFYNIEIQMSRQQKWSARSTYYLAKTLAGQLKSGEPYVALKPVIGIHLLGYDLFSNQEQAIWCFEMRDRNTPHVRLGSELQLNILELDKADRLAKAGKLPQQANPASTALNAWVQYFQHWKEDNIMNQIAHPPVQDAIEQLKSLSSNEETRYLVERRERALKTERTEIAAAEERGEARGEARGKTLGEAQGAMRAKQEALQSLIQSGMSEAQARAILHI